MSGAIVQLNQSNVAHTLRSNEYVAVKVWGPNCPHCMSAKAIWQQLQPGAASMCELNVSKAPALAKRWRIRAVPTFIIFRRGKEVARFSGAIAKKPLQQWLSRSVK